MTSPLMDFLEARIAEDERDARAAGGKTWHQYDALREHGRIEDEDGEVVTYDEGAPSEGEAAHIVRHDPARVLREVTAKRKLVADFKIELEDAERYEDVDSAATSLRLLGILAAIYSDHPDYRKEWAA